MAQPPPKLRPYQAALKAISSRTKTPLPSLIASFAILHELTAIVPIVSVFFIARSLGVGEYAVSFVRREVSEARDGNWIRAKGAMWLDEGEQWAARVGRRYGIFGFLKTPKHSESEIPFGDSLVPPRGLASDVANAVLAYGVTKAMLPARIGLSLYLAPAFSRRFLEPVRIRIMGIWRR
ncbi:hypothetical protein BU17DRAFT_56348 [Hysterangium stoloniferum]|nr:hypothetical protein BU17DRAFT_56348 [Hysterangium stoloniferum]